MNIFRAFTTVLRSGTLATRGFVRPHSVKANPTSGAVIELNLPKRRKYGEREIKGLGGDHLFSMQSIVLFVIPATTFGLGLWQIKRLKWKKGLIDELERSGNPTGIQYKNDHLAYCITWFMLSGVTGLMWAQKFLFKYIKIR